MRLGSLSLAVVSAIVCVSCASGGQTLLLTPVTTPEGVRFSLRRDEAKSVAVAGSFNQWSVSSHPMTREGAVWTGLVPLPAGEHLFMFVVDGTVWVTPPSADDFVDDGFGSKNGVVIVRLMEK